MKQFKGRIIVPVQNSTLKAEALVSRKGFNTLASFQKALMFKDKSAACSDQNNSDLYGKKMAGKALCMPQTIGSTTGGLVLFTAAALHQQPSCMLFSKPIDSLAAAGAILAGVWTENPMPTIDSLGDDFLAAVQTGATVTVNSDGVVTVE
jgi:predicted aconitase with swiveling domain